MKHRWFCVAGAGLLASALAFAQQAGSEGAGSSPSTPKSDGTVPQRVRVSQKVAQGLLINPVPPQYPEDARAIRIQGTVVLKGLIGKDGKIKELTTVSGHPLLAPAALKAVKQWKYKPYLLNGQPVEVETQISITFQLSGH